MVVFTCQKCNSTLKKNVVEKHFSCRPFFLTCIDCLKDFKGNEYDAHVSCITESEKYGGKKAVVKQQGVKQGKWAETAQEILSELSKNPKYHKFCGPLKQAANIPRNRNKFHNFVRSAHPRIYNSEVINEIFDHLEKTKINNKNEQNSSIAEPNSCSENIIENNRNVENNIKKKKKKNKKEIIEVENSEKLDESNAEKEGEINSKKRPLIETDFHSTEQQQNGTEVKKIKHELKIKEKISSDNPDFCKVVNNHQNKENEEDINESNGKVLHKSLDEETAGEGTDDLKLSKKERKKLRKLQKYKAQVAEIANAQAEEDPLSLEQEDKAEKKKKKKKKLKDEAMETETEHSIELSPKRKHEKNYNIEDVAGKKIKLNDTLVEEEIQIESGKKFKWGQVIKQILENSSDKELSLKKLRKKVMNEYWAQKGDDIPYEKLLGTFNKKINSTEGVKLVKDKAQLILT